METHRNGGNKHSGLRFICSTLSVAAVWHVQHVQLCNIGYSVLHVGRPC
jgi:hypothetical protein